MNLYLKAHQKCDISKLKIQFLLSIFGRFEFDFSLFLCHLRYVAIQYLIGKLLDVVKMSQEG